MKEWDTQGKNKLKERAERDPVVLQQGKKKKSHGTLEPQAGNLWFDEALEERMIHGGDG